MLLSASLGRRQANQLCLMNWQKLIKKKTQ